MPLAFRFIANIEGILSAIERTDKAISSALPSLLNNAAGELRRKLIETLSEEYNANPREFQGVVNFSTANRNILEVDIDVDPRKLTRRVWHTERDERVCPICQPRDGQIYTEDELAYLFPAHPNCRCSVGLIDLDSDVQRIVPNMMGDALEGVLKGVKETFEHNWKGKAK